MLQISGAFEVQHGHTPGIKNPAEAGCEGDLGVE
jgi:hypothetical protein